MKEMVIEKIIIIINDNMENAEITIDQLEDDLVAFGMDSITFIRVIVALEEEFECEIPDLMLDITKMNTIVKIHEVIKSVSPKKII